jgi:D-arabinose 1-dehydrogenase-like Zn-dependent alcohol dehydrogenase
MTVYLFYQKRHVSRERKAMKVQAAVHLGTFEEIVVRELDLEEPRSDEVLIKTAACGVGIGGGLALAAVKQDVA